MGSEGSRHNAPFALGGNTRDGNIDSHQIWLPVAQDRRTSQIDERLKLNHDHLTWIRSPPQQQRDNAPSVLGGRILYDTARVYLKRVDESLAIEL